MKFSSFEAAAEEVEWQLKFLEIRPETNEELEYLVENYVYYDERTEEWVCLI